MDSHNVRRKDTTKGPPLRVLSLGECEAQVKTAKVLTSV